jgi:hypothetical protein
MRNLVIVFLFICFFFTSLFAQQPIQLHQHEEEGFLLVTIDGKEAFIYRYTSWLDIPHIWPLYSPSGKNMLVQRTDPYPHHRSFYVADTVRLEGGREVSTYNALYSGQSIGRESYGPPFRDHIRHDRFTRLEEEGPRAVIGIKLVWEMEGNIPVLEEKKNLVIHSLDEGEYLIDYQIELNATFGDVAFVSDEVHYAWPFIRMHPRFSGENGGTISADNGAKGEPATNMKKARWIDYSNTLDGITEGLAIFQFPDGKDHRWLTREYGIFGPRRPDEQNGRPFMLRENESISQRVGILVHTGNVKTGRVAERYKKYIQNNWKS